MKCAVCDGHLYGKEMGAGSSIAVVAALATVSMCLQHYLSIYLCIYEYSYEPHVITTASQMLFVPTPTSRPHLLFCLSVCHAFAVCHKMWPYRRDFDAANLSKKFKCKNEPCRTIFRG